MGLIPYSRQIIEEEDISSVIEVLRSDWLTTGPKVLEFEEKFANQVGARYAISVSSGTAALHSAMFALGIGCGDEVIVPAITFAASANCVVYQGGTPVFVDVDPDTLLIDPSQVEVKINQRTKAIVAVDYAGHPCDYDRLREIAIHHDLYLVADACHSLGGKYKGRNVGTLADLTVFSFHPVKHITTGEGGMVVTDCLEFAERIRRFRNHGISIDHSQRAEEGTWYYEMLDLGYNYRLSDIQCALGVSQLNKLGKRVSRRQEIARHYDKAFSEILEISPLMTRPEVSHAYHLYVIRLVLERLREGRERIFKSLRSEGIGVNVHYIPVHLHPFYRKHFGTKIGDCPVAERSYERIISIPIFPAMKDQDIERVIEVCIGVVNRYLK